MFSGVVVDVEKRVGFSTSPPRPVLGRVTFDVEEAWKGISQEPVIVSGYGTGADCGIGFSEGQRYLVYALGEPGGGAPLSTTYCAGTRLLAKAERDLQELGPAVLTLPGSAEPESVESEPVAEAGAVDSTPFGGPWSGSPPVIAVASILLLLAAVGAFAFWRRRRSD